MYREDRDKRPRRGEGSEGGGEGGGAAGRKAYHRKRVCRFCTEPDISIDYKDAKALRPFITERGKILPRRMSGACAKHQREIATAIKRARNLAIIPFTAVSMDSGS